MSEISDMFNKLCWNIEKFPASELQTQTITMACEIKQKYASFEAEVAELRAYRDGYDPKVKMPTMGKHVWILVETPDSRQVWEAYLSDEFENPAKFYDSKYAKTWSYDRITRWWLLPEAKEQK